MDVLKPPYIGSFMVTSVRMNKSDWTLSILKIGDITSLDIRLPSLDWREFVPRDFQAVSEAISSDGCSGVPDFYLNGCIIHDFWYRTHQNFDGTPITKDQADNGLKTYIQLHSPFGRLSPMAQWRFIALQHLTAAQHAWDHDSKGSPLAEWCPPKETEA